VLAGVPALVVEGEEGGHAGLVADLLFWGLKASVVEDADAALAELGEPTDAPRQLVILEMPVSEGLAVAVRIQRAGESTIVLVSRGGHRGDGRRCREAGIDVYLTESASSLDLQEALRLVCSPAWQKGVLVTRHYLHERRHQLSILLAEDNPVNQKLAVAILEKAGHTVKVVGDGREALLQLEKNGFDLVLMDVQMPELDGLETTAEIRRREGEGGGHTSIIAMTAYAAPEDRRRCLAAGMDEYTTKPLKTEELFRLIDKICGGVADAAVAETELPPGDGSSDRSIVMDYDTAMSHMGDDADLLKEVADVFLQGCGQQMTEIEEAISAGDAEKVQRSAHALKGAVANFAADPARDAAQQLELMGKKGELDQADAAYQELERRMTGLVKVLGDLAGA